MTKIYVPEDDRPEDAGLLCPYCGQAVVIVETEGADGGVRLKRVLLPPEL